MGREKLREKGDEKRKNQGKMEKERKKLRENGNGKKKIKGKWR